MSWEYLCETCGKSIFSSSDWRGMHVKCEECEALNAKADREEALAVDKSIEADMDHARHLL